MSQAEELLTTLAETIVEHEHSVVDVDTYFVINPDTREITNASRTANTIMQYDHNSERFTFELPRYVEGHDMLLCNSVLVHWNNIDSETKDEVADVSDIDDLRENPDDTDTVICSWLISRNSTQHAGILSFLVQFKCVTDGETVYEWHSDIYSDVAVKAGRNNGEQSITDYTDILEQWRVKLFGDGDATNLPALIFTGAVEATYNGREAVNVEIPTNVSAFENDVGYLTEHQDLSELSDALANKIDKTNPAGTGTFTMNTGLATGVGATAKGNYTLAIGDYSTAEGDNEYISRMNQIGENCEVRLIGDAGATQYYCVFNWNGTWVDNLTSENVAHPNGWIEYNGVVAEVTNWDWDEGIVYLKNTLSETEPLDGAIVNLLEGYAGGYASHTEGFSCIADGDDSHAEGYNTVASGDDSHAEGRFTKALGRSSHAEGYNTVASGDESHAEGDTTVASGSYSHAEGYNTVASGDDSHAEGLAPVASGRYSHAEGRNTVASGNGSHAEGECNDPNKAFQFMQGNGRQDAESNAHTRDHYGNGWYASAVYVGGTPVGDDTNPFFSKTGVTKAVVDYSSCQKLATENYVDEAVANIDIPDEYVTETELSAKGYLTEHQSLDGYAKTSDIPTDYATKESLDAKADTDHTHDNRYYTETEIDERVATLNSSISAKADTNHNHDEDYDVLGAADTALASAKSYTDTKTSSLASTTVVDNKISTHNTSTSAHSDIRASITDLTTKLNNFSTTETWTFELEDGSTVTKEVRVG